MKKVLLVFLSLVLLGSGFYFFYFRKQGNILSPVGEGGFKVEKPLDKYTYESLRKKIFKPSEITFGKVLNDGKDFTSYIFYFNVDGKKVSGMANIPKARGSYPVIVMCRGFVEQKKYTIGEGTKHSGEVFASNGFITLAPDFLGYGESDPPSNDSIEERFQTYTTTATLLSSVKNLNQALQKTDKGITADTEKIGIWGHSNGGQIALSTLEITGKNYPTVLWAPVSKPFPYSVLYYTDEFDDHGKALRKVLANFEKNYDAEKYSLTNFLDWIKAPIEIHQGIDDEEVPIKWSNQLVQELKDKKEDVTYFTYPGEDHNFSNLSGWNQAVDRSISFYKENFEKNINK